jgi:hypothetical protein
MKKAGDLLSLFIDGEILKKARGYSDLAQSWKSIAGDNLAAHSRIVDLKLSVLMVEADHPGWIQILQTKQKALLQGVSRRFPDLQITGISFRLSRDPAEQAAEEAEPRRSLPEEAETVEEANRKTVASEESVLPTDADPYAHISDEQFRETLKRLAQTGRRRGGSGVKG